MYYYIPWNLLAFCSGSPTPRSAILRMSITFENDNDVIVYALEKIILYARNNQHIFLAQSVWWIFSILGLQQGLVVHIDHLGVREIIGGTESVPSPVVIQEVVDIPRNEQPDFEEPNHCIHPSRVARIQTSSSAYIDSKEDSFSKTETNIHNEMIENCEIFLQ